MQLELICPGCGFREVEFDDYQSLFLLSPNLAMMQFTCPSCGIQLSLTVKLNAEMQRHVKELLGVQGALAARTAHRLPDNPGASAPASASDAAPTSASAPANAQASANAPANAQASDAAKPSVSYTAWLVVEDGSDQLPCYSPLAANGDGLRARMERFKRQLDGVQTVDEIIEGIDGAKS